MSQDKIYAGNELGEVMIWRSDGSFLSTGKTPEGTYSTSILEDEDQQGR